VKTFGLENTLLPIGNELLEVVAPIRAGTAGGRHLERRGGDGGYMVITQCDDHEPRRKRIAELGIRKVLEFDVPGEFRDMQLHPKDTGGAFLEIDEQQGPRAHDPTGHGTPPALTGSARAEPRARHRRGGIQCDAGRWRRAGRDPRAPLARDPRGRPAIALENATLRFVRSRMGAARARANDGDRGPCATVAAARGRRVCGHHRWCWVASG
jgi:hypothetical protein